ncbi:MAG: NADH-quinone oxidoreductase subunit H [Planctomycetes bacterium]|nr:NADH-quinone oxidoreductase subunit H [Planctomycetota bacterium]
MDGFGEWIWFLLVFPGAAFAAGLGLVLSWADRKVSAMVQWRRGPPPSQPFLDVAKLLGKEVVVPATSWPAGFLAFPFAAFAAASLAAALSWHAALGLPGRAPGDLVVVLYLLAVPPLAAILGGAASGNPLGAVGASRHMVLVLGYELPLAAALLVGAFQVRTVGGGEAAAGTLSLEGIARFQALAGDAVGRPSGILALLVALLCCQAKLGLVPFDQAEADTEIAEGAFIEYSGPPLAIFRLTQAVLLAAMPALLVAVLWNGSAGTPGGRAALAGKVLLVVVLLVLVKNTNPRVRIDQALRFFWGPVTAAAALALLLARMGW